MKELAQRLTDDHNKSLDELKQIASRKNIPLPDATDPKQEALYERISKLNGVEFDKEWVVALHDQHRLDIGDCQKQADTSGDPELKSFAIKTLPIMQEHLRLVETILTQVDK